MGERIKKKKEEKKRRKQMEKEAKARKEQEESDAKLAQALNYDEIVEMRREDIIQWESGEGGTINVDEEDIEEQRKILQQIEKERTKAKQSNANGGQKKKKKKRK